jgi:hypothetical protein
MLGMSKERQETNAPTDAGDLADITLRERDGAEVRLGDFWRDRSAVLVWLRHYG